MKFAFEKYKKFRKNQLLGNFTGSKKVYAFIGIGQHSLYNLYPVIESKGVDLKYIFTRDKTKIENYAAKFSSKLVDDIYEIANDKEVNAVFICLPPSVQYNFSKIMLENGKHIFVEKPPCENISQLDVLIDLAEKNNLTFQVGIQKTHSSVYKLLKKEVKNPLFYNYKFITGSYPEGDVLLDLFIHPINNIINIFGEAEVISVQKISGTYLLHLKHKNVFGQLELSTDYSWKEPNEEIVVNCKNEVYNCYWPKELVRIPKSKKLANVPVEKIISKPLIKEQLFVNTGFIPVGKYNSLVTEGYWGEIACFVNQVEKTLKTNKEHHEELKYTYKLIEQIKKYD